MKVNFIEEIWSKGQIKKKSVKRTWEHLTKKQALTAVANFYEGVCFAMSKDYRRPINPWKDGFEIWSYNFHKDQSGFIYKFTNGKGKIIKQ